MLIQDVDGEYLAKDQSSNTGRGQALSDSMLVLTEDDKNTPQQVRALSAEFRGKILFATCLNTTERGHIEHHTHVGTSMQYNGFTTLFYQNSETPAIEMDGSRISVLAKFLSLRSPAMDVEVPPEELESDEFNIDKAIIVIKQLRDQGREEEAAKIEALIGQYQKTESETSTGSQETEADAEEAELRQLINVLRSQGQEEKAVHYEKMILEMKGAAAARMAEIKAQDNKADL